MQVDKSNFHQHLPQILKHIQQADFVAFDCEFSGLVTKLQRIQGMFSNHVQFYQRIKETAYNFRIIQLGLATFVYKENTYIPHVYNFYVSPSTFSPGYNNVMVCQVESMEFLAKNNLDFNRVFCQGIKSKRLYSNDIEQKHEYNEFPVVNIQNMFLSPQQNKVAEQIEKNVISEILQNPKLQRIVDFKNRNLFAYFRHKYLDMLCDKSKKNMKQFQYSIKIRPNYQKQKQKQKQDIKQQQSVMKNQAMTQTSKQQIKQITMQKKQVVEKKQQTKQKDAMINQEKQQNINNGNSGVKDATKQQQQPFSEQSACLSSVFAALINGRKTIIGHFPNLDIGLIYQTFIADLPETYQEFCYNLNHMFPYLFDTKVISRRIQSKLKGLKVDLSSLFKACFNPKLLKPYANFSCVGLQDYVQKSHEAGYDAFITGCSFIGMANYLSNNLGRINYKNIQQQNMLLYSRYSGQVSMTGNRYCSNAINYDNIIIIQSFTMAQQPKWRQLAKQLSKYGSLTVHQNHQELYYVYEQPQNIPEIIKQFPTCQLKHYSQRRIIYARNMYRQFQNIMI